MAKEIIMDNTPERTFQSLSFNKLQREVHVLMIPNEDGLGPSTALLYVARGMDKLARANDIKLKFIVWNKAKAGFNMLSYGPLGTVTPEFQEVDSVIQLRKDGEKVLPMETAEDLLDYLWKAKNYAGTMSRFLKNDGDIDCVICMGTPVAHPPAQSGARRVPVIEVFDHSWLLSLEQIFNGGRKEYPDDWRTRRVSDVDVAQERFGKEHWPYTWHGKKVDDIIQKEILPVIQSHDIMVDQVFLFPEPLAPGEFWCRWQSLVPGKVKRIAGVMGGWPDGSGEDQREDIRNKSRIILANRLKWAVTDIKEARIILVQGGGTPIWDRFLVHMLGQCLDWEGKLQNTLFLFTKGSVENAFNSPTFDKLTAKQRGWETFAKLQKSVEASSTARLVMGNDEADFANFQMFYLVADLIFSRPGGITVQDAIACRTPLVCAAEPGHWQTEKIRHHCLLHGIMRDVAFQAFQAGGIGLVLDQFGMKEGNKRMVDIMRTIPNQQETKLAEEIFSIIADRIARQGVSE